MNEAVLHKIFEQATTAILVYQEGAGIRYANPRALSILGINREQLSALSLTHFFPTDSNQKLFLQLQDYHKSFVYRKAILHPQDGPPVPADLSVHTLSRSRQGRRISQFNIYPATPSSSASSPKIETTQANDTSVLLGVLRKQTNMPLHALNSLVNRLLQMQPRADQLPFLHSMLQSGEQLKTNLDDIMLYTDLIYGKYRPEPAVSFRPGQLLEELKQQYQAHAKAMGNRLIVDTADLGEASYMSDIQALRLMIGKLLENALRFTRNSLIKLMVHEESREAGNALLRFEVEDEGIGMNPDQLKQAVQAFVSWKSPWEQENRHSGLGLSIVQQLAATYGGKLSLQSRPGNTLAGFTINCNLNPEDAQPALNGTEAEPNNLKGLKLLYVEDLLPNHFLMEGLCSIWQVSLDTAYNGREALSKFYVNSYDIVLMDLNMPLMDGFETSMQIRQSSDLKRQSIPIIAVTGSVNLEKQQHVRKCGINDILIKPIKPDKLYQKLSSFSGS